MAIQHISSLSEDPDKQRTTGTQTRAVLVATADASMLSRCVEALSATGIDIEQAECGVEALKVARKIRPELILIDMELRDVNGFELARWLRSDPTMRSVPIIAFSAYTADQRDPRANELGLLAVLRKPVRAGDVDAWVRRAIH